MEKGRLFQSDRRSRRIDYSNQRVIRARAAAKQEQRAHARSGTWVVGRFVLQSDRVVLLAIPIDAAYSIPEGAPHTATVRQMYRWNTRQAARQWLMRHPDARLDLVNLASLRGREGDDETIGVASATTSTPDVPGQLTLADVIAPAARGVAAATTRPTQTGAA